MKCVQKENNKGIATSNKGIGVISLHRVKGVLCGYRVPNCTLQNPGHFLPLVLLIARCMGPHERFLRFQLFCMVVGGHR